MPAAAAHFPKCHRSACGRARRWCGCHRLRCHNGRVKHAAVTTGWWWWWWLRALCVVCVCVCVCVFAVCVQRGVWCACRVAQGTVATLRGFTRADGGGLPYARVATAPLLRHHSTGVVRWVAWRCAASLRVGARHTRVRDPLRVGRAGCAAQQHWRQQQRACRVGSPIGWCGVDVATSDGPTPPAHRRQPGVRL